MNLFPILMLFPIIHYILYYIYQKNENFQSVALLKKALLFGYFWNFLQILRNFMINLYFLKFINALNIVLKRVLFFFVTGDRSGTLIRLILSQLKYFSCHWRWNPHIARVFPYLSIMSSLWKKWTRPGKSERKKHRHRNGH